MPLDIQYSEADDEDDGIVMETITEVLRIVEDRSTPDDMDLGQSISLRASIASNMICSAVLTLLVNTEPEKPMTEKQRVDQLVQQLGKAIVKAAKPMVEREREAHRSGSRAKH